MSGWGVEVAELVVVGEDDSLDVDIPCVRGDVGMDGVAPSTEVRGEYSGEVHFKPGRISTV